MAAVVRPTKRNATYADIEALPEHLTGELIDGELFVSPRPAARHAKASTVLSGELMGPFQLGRGGPGGWWILFEPELHLGAHVLVPDLAGWRAERMPQIPDTDAIELAPDWVCEVASPSTAHVDRARKLPHYARTGVGHMWIADPIGRTLEVLRLVDGHYSIVAVHADAARIRAEPFDAIELDLALGWLPDA